MDAGFAPLDDPRHYSDDASQGSPPLRPTPFALRDPRCIPPREWLYVRHYARKYASGTVAPPGLGKTSLSIVEALAMVSGKPLLGARVREPLRVWLFNAEDPAEELERRITAAGLHYGIASEDIGDRLFVDSGRDTPFRIAERRGDGGIVLPASIDILTGALRERRIDVLVLDPFISFHSVPENDNGAIDAVVKAFGRVAQIANASVELVAHVKKPGLGQESYTVHDIRGASSFVGAVRSARILNPMTAGEAEAAKVPVEERGAFFRVGGAQAAKANMAPVEAAVWRKLVSVSLGNETPDYPADEVGVVTAWELPAAMDVVTVDHMHEVRRKVGAAAYRVDVQARDWVGRVVAEVVGLDVEDKGDRHRIKSILGTWFKSGALAKEMRPDSRREMREFVVPGPLEGSAAP